MTAFTPNFAIPYQTVNDPPSPPGRGPGEDGFLVVDAGLTGLDSRLDTLETELKMLDAVDISLAGGLYTTSGTTELDIGRLAHTNVAVETGRVYCSEVQLITTRSVASDEFTLRVRQGTAVSGTLLGSQAVYASPVTAGHLVKAAILWVPASTTTTTIFLSVVRAVGSGTMTVFGAAGGGRSQSMLSRLGPSSRYRTINS